MRILIDTHILNWHLEGSEKLLSAYRVFISDPSNTILISIASCWEIAIKSSRGKLVLRNSIEDIVAIVENSTSRILPISLPHVLKTAALPFNHNDPFDRMIIAQSLVENIPIITADGNFSRYGVELL